MKKILSKKNNANNKIAVVYMSDNISSEGLMSIYKALGRKASGKVAVKLSTGEPGGHYFLSTELIKTLVQTVKGTIVECNTVYGGRRTTTESHRQVAQEHGFTAIAQVDIMDANGDMSIPITGGKHLKADIVGANLANYDFMIDLVHFKGHVMAGFGGALKNLSIGVASSRGKSLIHSGGTATTGFGTNTPQDIFLESMAEAAKAVVDYEGEHIIHISVMNYLSIDCDCITTPAKPEMEDIGILASLDPVALDQACIDLVYAAPDGNALIKRIEAQHGIYALEYAEAIGLGTRNYNLFSIDD